MAEKGRMTAAQVVDKIIGGEHVDVVRESVAWLVGELMEAEVAAQIGAGLGEVSGERVTHRNGYELPREHWSKLRSTNPLERVNARSAGAPTSSASSPTTPR
jgi:transposase-like protein